MKNGKRLFAILLCLTMVLPLLPISPVTADTTGMKKAEAENRLQAYWNGYSTTENNSNASGGVQVGGSDASRNVHYADLKEGVDLSNTAYIKWTVNAPESGNYDIAMRAHIKIGGSHSGKLSEKVYVTFFVNGKTPYKAAFNGENSWVYDTDTVSVALEKGSNEIIAIPLVKDILDTNGWGWANADCLYIDNQLTAVKNVIEAEDTEKTIWNGYSTTENNNNASGGVQVGGSDASRNVHYADLKEGVDLSNTAYIKWTVNAPESGNYDIAMRAHIRIGGSHSGKLSEKVYVTFFVNGKTPYKAAFNGENSWVYDTDTVSVALEKGNNEIIAIPLVKDIIDEYSWGWANADCLYLDSRLTAGEKEKEPVLVAVEAEDTLYAAWNTYTKTESNTNCSDGVEVGGGNAANNVAYTDLQEGVDLSKTAYVKWTVNAPTAGEYTVALRYHPYAEKFGNNKDMDPAAYAAFFVNGKNAYQAEFLGKSNWIYDTEKIKITLAEGDNEILVIPMVQELLESYEGGWANVDCLYIEESLTPVKNKVEAEDEAYAQWNLFSTTENRTDCSGGVIVGGGSHGKNIAFADLKKDTDLSNTAYIRWFVEAPADGDYAIALRYLMKANDKNNGTVLEPAAYATFFVNGETPYKAEFLGKNGWVYDTETIMVNLKKGVNEIVAIPLVKEVIEAQGSSWANVDCLYLDNRLNRSLPEEPAVLVKAEAEDTYYAVWNNYTSTENRTDASGGVIVGGGKTDNNVLYGDLAEGVDLSGTAYVKWTVNAPETGEYAIALRYLMKAGPLASGEELDSGAYAAFFINGKTPYKAKFLGKNNWVYDTEVIEVNLEKGENEIIAIPFVKDLIDSYGHGWANVDCLYYEDTLTLEKATKAEAEDTDYAGWNNYTVTEENSNASAGVLVGGGDASKNISYTDLQAGGALFDTSYVKWTVTAPADGQYSFSLRYSLKAGNQENNAELNPGAYAAFYVNGTAYQAKFLGKNNWVYDTEDVKIALKKGENEIIAIPITAEQVESYDWAWANVDCLYYDSRLTLGKNRVEAENDAYTGWNIYSTPENNSNASGGVLLGGGDASKNVAYADLKEGVRLNNTSYVVWQVHAPADGEYAVALRYQMKAGNQDNNVELIPEGYAAFFVNGEAAYKAEFLGLNSWVYDTEFIKLNLKAGINEIVAIPLVQNLVTAYSWAWANVDCLYLDGRLTVLPAPEISDRPTVLVQVEAENTEFTCWNGYNTTQDHNSASGEKMAAGGSAEGNVYYNELVSGVNLSATSYVQWTFDVPAAGEYTFKLRYNPRAKNVAVGKELTPDGYAAFFVNGETAYQAAFLGKNDWVYDTEEISIYLNAGINTVIAIPMVKDLYDAWGGGWANVDCLYYDSLLTLQKAPVKLKVEAEDTEFTYWNSYSTTQDHNSASGGKMAAGGSVEGNVYYNELVSGVDLSATGYVQWTFDVPAAGEYAFKLRYNPRAKNVAVGKDLTPGGYAAFFVNGETAYQAAFLGKNDWVYDTEEISIYLNAGINTVIAIPMVKDLYDAWGGGWANVDCLYYDSLLTLQKAPVKIKVEAEDRSLTYWNGYANQEPHNSASGGYQAAGSSAQNNVYYRQLKKGVDLTYTAYVKWIISSPEEGDYTFSLRYAPTADKLKAGVDLNPGAYAAFFVNGKDAYKAEFLGYNKWVYNTKEVTIHLKKGDNEVIAIPMVQDLYKAWGGGWANVDCLYMQEGLSVKPTGYVPDNRIAVEAEDTEYVQWNLYKNTESHNSANGKLVAAGSDAAANLYLEDLKPGADLSGTAYLKWTIIAPSEGDYSFCLRYAAKEDGVKTGDAFQNGTAYATFFINDSDVYTAKLTGFGSRCNWLWNTEDVRIHLQKGENTFIVIPMIKDLYDAWGGGWANVDSLYMSPSLSLKQAPVYTRFEAENSEFNLYEGYADHVGLEAWGTAWENDVTFDNLNEETIVGVSHVKYYVHAEKAGTYRIGLGFRQGHSVKEYKNVYFGLSVNLEEYYKVPFVATNTGNNRLQYIDVELQEGDNYIYATACLKDFMDYPNFPSQKGAYVLWIDHDYILLPEGLTSTVASALPQWTGDDQADYNQSLHSVWGDLTGNPNQPLKPTPEPQKTQNIFGWVIGVSVGSVFILLALILLLVKKKDKENP